MHVSSYKSFAANRWRECFLYYLFGVWSGDREVTSRTEISFDGGVALQLDFESDTYSAVGSTVKGSRPSTLGITLSVGCKHDEVESALVRLVKNNAIQNVIIHFDEGQLFLWKTSERSRIGVVTLGVPTRQERARRTLKIV